MLIDVSPWAFALKMAFHAELGPFIELLIDVFLPGLGQETQTVPGQIDGFLSLLHTEKGLSQLRKAYVQGANML